MQMFQEFTRDDAIMTLIIVALVLLPSRVPSIGNFLGRLIKGRPAGSGS
ncbi:MAG: hypothetical protein ACK4N5_21660 [Myxococcales bacterium]